VSHNRRLMVQMTGGGRGVLSVGKRPRIDTDHHGRGVRAIGQMPHVHGNPTGGAGVRSWERRDSLVGYMTELAERLRDVTVPGGSWRQCLGPTPLMHTPTSPQAVGRHTARPALPHRRQVGRHPRLPP